MLTGKVIRRGVFSACDKLENECVSRRTVAKIRGSVMALVT